MEQQEKATFEISFGDILRLFKKRWWQIAAALVVCAILGFCYSNFTVDQKYESSAMIYIKNKTSSTTAQSSSDVAASKYLVDTYSVFLTAPETLLELKSDAGVSYTPTELKKMIKSGAVNDTEILQLTVTGTNAEEVKTIAEKLSDIVVQKGPLVIEGTSATLVSGAQQGAAVSRGVIKITMLGAIIGFLLMFAFYFCYDFLIRDVIESKDWLKNSFGGEIPVLAAIPDSTATSYRDLRYATKQTKSANGEGFDHENE